MMDGGTAGLPQPGDVNASMYSWKRESSLFSSFVPACRSFVVYTCKKKNSNNTNKWIYTRWDFFLLFMEGRQPFRSENRFPIDFPMCRLPTYTYICNWASVTWKEKQDFKRSSGVFSYWRRTGHGSHHFQGHMYTDTRMHMKRRERAWNSFLAFIVGCRQPTLAQSDTRR
jgi:hypothetical protein